MNNNRPILFCFPYAGGNASSFEGLANMLRSNICLVCFDYPGHGERRKDLFSKNAMELADEMYSQVLSVYQPGRPYGIFGYSMGCITAVEVLKRIIQKKEIDPPVHVFLAAHKPETIKIDGNFNNANADEFVKKRIINLGNIPESLLNNPSFWRFYLPVYKSDFNIIRNYVFEDLNLHTNIPATILYSEEDTPLNKMLKWQDVFVRSCDFSCFDGTHFFLFQHESEIGHIIEKSLT